MRNKSTFLKLSHSAKIVFFSLVTPIICSNVFSQPAIITQTDIGGTDIEYLGKIYLTKDGGLIMGGASKSNASGTKTENSRGGYDFWIIKYNSNQTIRWDKTYGGIGDDYLTSIQQTTDGGYILGGYSNSNISYEKTENSRGGVADFWIIKIDSIGGILWQKTIGGNGDDFLSDIQQTNDGGYIFGGRSNSNVSGEKTENSRGSYDYWIAKINATGNIQWQKTIGGNDWDALNDLEQTSDGGYILGGFSSSGPSGEKSQRRRGATDYWAVKISGSGNIQWDRTLGATSAVNTLSILTSVHQQNDGSYILGGFSNGDSSFEKTENSRGYNDYWLVKLNANGSKQWDKTIGGDANDELYSLELTKDGGYILGGSSYSNTSGEKTENSRGLKDYWVVKTDAQGKVQWDKTIGGSSDDDLYSVKEIKRNKYVLGGISGSDISGDKTKSNYGSSDFWIVLLQYKNTLSSKEISYASSNVETLPKSVSIYPNPVKNILHIQSTAKATFTLTNQSGKILLTKTINGNGEINVSHLPAGLYYLKNNETGIVQKVIITK